MEPFVIHYLRSRLLLRMRYIDRLECAGKAVPAALNGMWLELSWHEEAEI
jgi:hypothetical protein